MDYGGSLENCRRCKPSVGSNPTPSAIFSVLTLLMKVFISTAGVIPDNK